MPPQLFQNAHHGWELLVVKRWFTHALDLLVYLIVRLVVCVVQAVPIEVCEVGCEWMSVLACDVLRIRHRVTKANLRQAYPNISEEERRRIVRGMWKHLGLLICEVAQAPRKIHETNWRKYVDFHRQAELIRYMLQPRPTVLVLGHFGNFEAAGYVSGLLGTPTVTIARDLDNPYLHKWINEFRGLTGQVIIPKEGSTGKIQELMDSNGKLALLGDQHAGPKGCWVDFFGRPASCYKSLSVLCLVGGAPLITFYNKRTTGPLHFELGIEGVIDPANLPDEIRGVRELTEWYCQSLERMIRDVPDQYWWLHQRWKGEPPASRRREKKIKVKKAVGNESENENARAA